MPYYDLVIPRTGLRLTESANKVLRHLGVEYVGQIVYQPNVFKTVEPHHRKAIRGALQGRAIQLPANHPLQAV
jgi:hypothetical protein